MKIPLELVPDLSLHDLDNMASAVKFRLPDGRTFWIGSHMKRIELEREPFFTCDQIRRWWEAGADVDLFLRILTVACKFPGLCVDFLKE